MKIFSAEKIQTFCNFVDNIGDVATGEARRSGVLLMGDELFFFSFFLAFTEEVSVDIGGVLVV